MWTESDDRYWIEAEARIEARLVDLEGRGFVLESSSFKQGWTDDLRIRVRPALAEGLERARAALPAGHNFKLVSGWRSWAVQQKCAEQALAKLRAAHPEWPEERLFERRREMAPLARIVPGFDSHRYGGEVDLTVVDATGQALDMGVPFSYVTGPEAALLWYELKPELLPAEVPFRDHRRMLMRAMSAGHFEPYLAEWWHWGMRRDCGAG
ncbi:MAG: D-alanyl-D-alanine carboxypeptidase family protein [Planctomycetota bacterium]|nr:D-alanyl-D-alanine carboxypeptidase family protein [Planctomycetota bacterium]